MILLVILGVVVGIIISSVIFGLTGSFIGFIIVGVLLVGIGLIYFLSDFMEDHPMIMDTIYLIATIICAFTSISMEDNPWPVMICVLAIGFLKGSFLMADADTSWYDTDFFSIDGILYEVFSPDCSEYITVVGVVAFTILYGLLGLPYVITNEAFWAFIPSIFFLIRFIRNIITLVRGGGY